MNNTKSNPVRICFVAPKAYGLFDPRIQTGFGGAEVDLYLLAAELAKDSDFDVSFITADYGQIDGQTIENVRILKSLDWKQNSLVGAMKIRRALKQARADMYMIKTASPGVPLVWAFCRTHRKKFLYRTAHSSECDGTYIKKHPLLGRLFAFCLGRADGVFVQNQSDSEQLRRTMRVESLVIPNGHRKTTAAACRRDHVLWVGRSVGFKQPQRYLELARQFPHVPFIMICRQAAGDLDYQSLQKQAGQISNLKFIQNADFHDIDKYFARAMVFVNTSDAEGFANTFIHAAKNGTAILSFAVNPDDFLTRFACGLCCGGNFTMMVRGLDSLLQGAKYLQAGENAKKYFGQRHDIEKIARKYKAVLFGLVGR